MGNEQYVQHDWSYVVWALMLTGMVVAVLAAMGLFLVMVSRACQATAPQRDAAADAAVDTAVDTAVDADSRLGSAPAPDAIAERPAGPAAA